MVTSISTVAVVGAGYMGGGIAQSLALAGLPVTIADVSADAAKAALERLLVEAREFEDAGLFDAGATETIRANLSAAPSIEEAVADVDFVEEAVFEQVEVKHDVLARISAAARPDAIIGSNTSTIPARTLSTAVQNPERFLTVHFSNPAPFIPGVELVLGDKTDEAVVPVVKELLGRANRQAAIVADVPGFVLNRLQYVLLKEAMSIAEEGIATPEDIDTIVRTTFGFRLGFFGPFAIADQAGLDVYAGGFRTFEEAFGERLATPQLIKDAVADDRRGVKNGKGLLRDYTPEQVKALVAYRNKAYSEMGRLVRTLGPAPTA
ncbi:3-hydroxyacyl-CoA dehydrogenase family protein [Puerhibacterium puerhi]|uniref:3-hydroxyacyl-CoA dehydrogenase family protein n=1 Tax=Puerhibacterium puerhi TaxID=2692623 RepID=UPI00135C4168|nr:3-hydroxyacyl-CoA dehydrogenase family protein [Puerhibacterium puerhi]